MVLAREILRQKAVLPNYRAVAPGARHNGMQASTPLRPTAFRGLLTLSRAPGTRGWGRGSLDSGETGIPAFRILNLDAMSSDLSFVNFLCFTCARGRLFMASVSIA